MKQKEDNIDAEVEVIMPTPSPDMSKVTTRRMERKEPAPSHVVFSKK